MTVSEVRVMCNKDLALRKNLHLGMGGGITSNYRKLITEYCIVRKG